MRRLLTDFLYKFSEAKNADGFPGWPYGRLAKLVEGCNEVQLKCLYDDCAATNIPF